MYVEKQGLECSSVLGYFFLVYLRSPGLSLVPWDGGVPWKMTVYNNVDALPKKLSNSM